MSQDPLPSPAQKAVANAAAALIQLAEQNGLTLTIYTEPLEPLAMGNYRMKISVRKSHKSYRGKA